MRTYLIRFELNGKVHELPAELPIKEYESGNRMLTLAHRLLEKFYGTENRAILLRVKYTELGKQNLQAFQNLVPAPEVRRKRSPPSAEPVLEVVKTAQKTSRTTRGRSYEPLPGSSRKAPRSAPKEAAPASGDAPSGRRSRVRGTESYKPPAEPSVRSRKPKKSRTSSRPKKR